MGFGPVRTGRGEGGRDCRGGGGESGELRDCRRRRVVTFATDSEQVAASILRREWIGWLQVVQVVT